ncbi:hypothetical protein WA1_16505 [Scytonema hofmannii PCC 7110]|uniref:Uncharacterized protein n=1 Tax=Scytonema hofmannii PCC 7110 TaxID=128403 RepID=A0A139XAB9_9CYAN|nr:hypothetical protein [Scytonema hofmannii]KYC41648.1 hypothetical protein WA1_16505 [Scytonema hofmannii PCC 7110]
MHSCSTEQTETRLASAFTKITQRALASKKPIVVEKLDFFHKKKDLNKGKKYNRMLSGFADARSMEKAPRPCRPRMFEAIVRAKVTASLLKGATHLFAALSVAEGLIYGCCRPTKTFLDFQAFLLEVLILEAIRLGVRHIDLILDNGSTHAPKQLQA